jgi:hypothetical protein
MPLLLSFLVSRFFVYGVCQIKKSDTTLYPDMDKIDLSPIPKITLNEEYHHLGCNTVIQSFAIVQECCTFIRAHGNIPDDSTFHSHCCEKRKSSKC